MPNENQQTTTPAPATSAPAANDTKTSWNFGDFAKGFETPFTKNPDNSLNLAGALLVGGGSGLASWVLSRMLGIKGGPSLGISILAALAGAHGSLAMQSGGDIFNFDYLKGLIDKNRGDKGVPPPDPLKKELTRFESVTNRRPGQVVSAPITNKDQLNSIAEVATLSDKDLREAARTLVDRELSSSARGKAIQNELAIRNKYGLTDENRGNIEKYLRSIPGDKFESMLIEGYDNGWKDTPWYKAVEKEADYRGYNTDRENRRYEFLDELARERGKQMDSNFEKRQADWEKRLEGARIPTLDDILHGDQNQLMEAQVNPEADRMGNGTSFYPSVEAGKDLQKALNRSRYRMMDSIPSGAGANFRLGTVYPIAFRATETAKTPPMPEPIPKVPEPEQSIKLPNIPVNPRLRYHPSFINPLTAYFGTTPHGISRQQPISKPVAPPRPQIRWNNLPPGMNPNDAIQMAIYPNDEIVNAIRNQ